MHGAAGEVESELVRLGAKRTERIGGALRMAWPPRQNEGRKGQCPEHHGDGQGKPRSQGGPDGVWGKLGRVVPGVRRGSAVSVEDVVKTRPESALCSWSHSGGGYMERTRKSGH